MTATRGELPLRIARNEAGDVVIRCLCGLESSSMYRGTVNNSMTGLRSSGAAITRLRPDASPAAVLAMVIHAEICQQRRTGCPR